VTAIWYLNDGFDGGEIDFELQQLTIASARAFGGLSSDAAICTKCCRAGTRYTMAVCPPGSKASRLKSPFAARSEPRFSLAPLRGGSVRAGPQLLSSRRWGASLPLP
jgi:hypothetical protein